tara:strand:+ start:1423 stop:3198 length:1776 start_codon:yes stop_codon:yes gene_type:complete
MIVIGGKGRQVYKRFIFSGGLSFVELIITIAVFTLIFSALFAGVNATTKLVGVSKAKAGALSLMVNRMEYIRSLPYNDIGTVSGVPSGNIPQLRTTTLNGVTYTERVLVQYVDDAADGVGGADGNGILADYKQIKVEYTWSVRGMADSNAIVSSVVPQGIETTAGGGTIRVNVFDANVLPVSGAEVRFVNNTAAPAIDTIRYTDPSGVVYLSGAPAVANYEIIVTDSGYSTDGTYTASTTNPNPITPPIAVLESQISTMNFQIDQLSDLTIYTYAPATYNEYFDTFSDASGLFAQASTTVNSGSLLLTDTLGVYDAFGTATSASTTPASIDSWYALNYAASTSASTTVRVFVLYDNAGTLMRIPNADLPGNSVGFTSSPVDLSELDLSTYGTLALATSLDTTDTAYTPQIHWWELRYIEAQAAISGVQLAIEGDKSIGTDGGGQDVLKYADTGTTDANGVWDQSDIEYDIYDVSMLSGGYDVYEMCPASPLVLDPAVTEEMSIVLGAAAGNMLRVNVTETDGTPIPDASVRLQNTGVDELSVTSLCGQTYFGTGLYADDDYLLTVSAGGFTTEVIASTTVSSDSSVSVILN